MAGQARLGWGVITEDDGGAHADPARAGKNLTRCVWNDDTANNHSRPDWRVRVGATHEADDGKNPTRFVWSDDAVNNHRWPDGRVQVGTPSTRTTVVHTPTLTRVGEKPDQVCVERRHGQQPQSAGRASSGWNAINEDGSGAHADSD